MSLDSRAHVGPHVSDPRHRSHASSPRAAPLHGSRFFRSCIALGALVTISAAAQAQGVLGVAQQFSVLGGSAVTNTLATTLTGDLGVFPGSSITGAGSITFASGVNQGNNAVSQLAKTNSFAAYVSLASLPFTTNLTGQDLGGLTLTPGVYRFTSSAQLTGNLILNFLGNPNSVFVFQIGSTLTTASASSVTATNAAPGAGVFWNIGTSATLGTTTAFIGNILADQSITLNTGATIACGRAIALVGAVTMINNTVSNSCPKLDQGSGGFGGTGTTVPEPSTFALFGVSLLGLAVTVRRRRAG